MPIEVDAQVEIFSQSRFHELAEPVIGIIFDVHNEFGCLLDEDIYKASVRNRCEAIGITPARREVEIQVIHKDFNKSLFMDLLFANGLMVETKTVERLTKTHLAQALQYLHLVGMHHGLLINLRPTKVEKQFVSTTLDLSERRRYEINDAHWNPRNRASEQVRTLLLEILDDWGAFLQTNLYREALIHFLGGPEDALQRIPVLDGSTTIGTQEAFLISADTALAITALSDKKEKMRVHLSRFLTHTSLTCMQWINLDRHQVDFNTLTK